MKIVSKPYSKDKLKLTWIAAIVKLNFQEMNTVLFPITMFFTNKFIKFYKSN